MPFVVPKLLNTNDNCYIIFMCTIHASNTSLIYKISVPRNSPEDPLCCPSKQHFIIPSHQFSLISIDNFSINVSACKPTTPPPPTRMKTVVLVVLTFTFFVSSSGMQSFLAHSCNMPTSRGVDFIKFAGSISYIYLSLPFLPNVYVTSSIQVSPKILPFSCFFTV